MNNPPQFTWDDLQFFLAVARTGQLSTAARQLRTSHATVSRRIDRLEFALKVKLFERNPRGYVMTAMGARFVETAEKMEQETERLRADLTDGATTQRGVVRLSAPEGFSNFFFARVLPQFVARHPNLSLELVTIQQIMSLSRKEADITVVLDEPKGGPYFSDKLTDYHLQVYGSRDYLHKSAPITCRDDLLGHPFISYIEEMIFAPGLDYLRRASAHQAAVPELEHLCAADGDQKRSWALRASLFLRKSLPRTRAGSARRGRSQAALLDHLPSRSSPVAASACGHRFPARGGDRRGRQVHSALGEAIRRHRAVFLAS